MTCAYHVCIELRSRKYQAVQQCDCDANVCALTESRLTSDSALLPNSSCCMQRWEKVRNSDRAKGQALLE